MSSDALERELAGLGVQLRAQIGWVAEAIDEADASPSPANLERVRRGLDNAQAYIARSQELARRYPGQSGQIAQWADMQQYEVKHLLMPQLHRLRLRLAAEQYGPILSSANEVIRLLTGTVELVKALRDR